MLEAKITVTHEAGLQARPAALFVQVANRFTSRIWITKGTKKVNAKSILGVMSLGVVQGDEVTITIDGEDEGTAMFTMKKLIISNFSDIPQNDNFG
ncbi:MAG: HPr family phosphocarrier protein [Clostridiales bacterium]|nr:HPr family phosphocarrier protein [Clostridiales bacterium]